MTGVTGVTGVSGAGQVGTGLDTEALITNRDGIAGQWKPPAGVPASLKADSPENLELWAPEIRDRIFDFELFSRISFSQHNGTVSVWYVEGSPGTGQNTMGSRRLVELTRPSEETFKAQLEFVEGYAALRPERASEIHAQLGVPNAFYGSLAYLQRAPWTTELLYAALRLALLVEQRCKHGLACRRPSEFSPQVQPIIPTPRHGTLPSGHATEAFICAFVLAKLLRQAGEAAKADSTGNPTYAEPQWAEQLMRQAARIAINRQVAGVHFPVDSAAGTVLGLALGHYVVSRCDGATPWRAWSFDGTRFTGANDAAKDYFWDEIVDSHALSWKKNCPYALAQDQAEITAEPSPTLAWLWEKAMKEWS